jgi:hypothetical protein
MNFGFDRPLYLLPFDHRESFKTRILGWQGPLTEDQVRQMAAAKQVIYEGFTAASPAECLKTKPEFSWTSSSAQRSCAMLQLMAI